jgi:hypothetical protein
MAHVKRSLILAACLVFTGCAGDDGAQLVLDLDNDLTDSKKFFDAPWPSDVRVDADGHPIVDGWPTRDSFLFDQLRVSAKERRGFPVLPVAWFQFTKPVATRAAETTIAADVGSEILLIDIDTASPERGRLFPTVARTMVTDDYLPPNVLAVAPRPGFILAPKRTYAFVVMRKANDAGGKLLSVAPAMRDLAAGRTPSGKNGAAAAQKYAPLFDTTQMLGIHAEDIAAATPFTTGDVVQETFDISTGIVARNPAVIHDLVIDPDDGAQHDRFCELIGKIRLPQFQKGLPPFDQDGSFEFGSDGLPILQRMEEVPITVTLPKLAEMPAAGYPLAVYFHGSGGLSSQVVDRGKREMGEMEPKKGEGPSFVLAPHGFATAGSAHPVNPERVPGATETQYLNFNNLASFRDIFRQGVIEQRLYMEALRTLEVPPSLVTACNMPALPAGATAYKFDPGALVAMGQSMGGMYTNLVGAVEPRVRAVVPTGAGGFWNLFITVTSLIPNGTQLLAAVLAIDRSEVTFMHPGLVLLETAWEPAEPLAYMPRLAHRPLMGHPVRPVYEPVGKDDSYFPTTLYDAIALAYDHQQAGEVVWPSMQEALALDGRSGLVPYPVSDNRTSLAGGKYTGAVVQYLGDGYSDPHSIFAQLDAVKFQYGCFLETFIKTGTAVIAAPMPLGTACPQP